jgi:small multidrug resistance pump
MRAARKVGARTPVSELMMNPKVTTADDVSARSVRARSGSPVVATIGAAPVPRWLRLTLWLAAGYNLLWGAWVILFPLSGFELAGMDPPRYPQIWQCVGMIVGVYGIGYAVAAFDPVRHWPIVLVGLLGKIFGPIGFLEAAVRGTLPWKMGWTIITNDLIWWLPFVVILRLAWQRRQRNV